MGKVILGILVTTIIAEALGQFPPRILVPTIIVEALKQFPPPHLQTQLYGHSIHPSVRYNFPADQSSQSQITQEYIQGSSNQHQNHLSFNSGIQAPANSNSRASSPSVGSSSKELHSTYNGQPIPLTSADDSFQADQSPQSQNIQYGQFNSQRGNSYQHLKEQDSRQNSPGFFKPSESEYNQQSESVVTAIGQSQRQRQTPPKGPSKQPNASIKKEIQPLPQLDDAEGIRSFAWDLFKAANTPFKNSIMSPISVQTLVKGLEDAAGNKLKSVLQSRIRTKNEDLTNYLEGLVDASQNSVNKIDVATAYFIANDFHLNSKYARTKLLSKIDMIPINVNNPVEASNLANSWVSEKTHKTINKVLNPEDVNAALRLLLINAIHFKGQWRHKFANTTDAIFETSPGVTKTVPQMYQFNKLRSGDIVMNNNDKNSIGKWLELPYDGDQLGMVFMLPNERHQLEAMIDQMSTKHLQYIYDEVKDGYITTKVHLNLPRFRMKNTRSLTAPLKKLGLDALFEPNAIDKLSNEQVRVSDAKQQADISVDENGTVASAVTSLNIITLSIHPTYKVVNFTVDQPFLGMIVDKENGVPLFIFKAVDI